MKTCKRIFTILKRTGALKAFIAFIIMCAFASIIFKYSEPTIDTIWDGFWYCFVSSTTIGFGDFYANTVIGRIVTIIISISGMFVFAMMTGVIISYYNEYLHSRKNQTISMFLEKLENLPNLSKEELEEISKKVKKVK